MKMTFRRTLAALVSTATAVIGLQAIAPQAQANTGGSAIVINEVYGGGGNSGAPYNQDFVELYNPTGSSVPVSGMSVQYRSGTGTANPSGVIALTGSIASHGYYLVGAGTGATGSALPTPDAAGTGVNFSATAGTIFLANQTAALTSPPTGSITNNSAIIDLVGFGTSNTFETAPTAAPSNTTSVSRNATHDDTDKNNVDLTTGAPSPLNSTAGVPTPLALANVPNQAGFRNTPIKAITLAATGGTAPYAYSVTGEDGNGLSVSSTGVITGAPSATGTYHLAAKVTDSATTPASVTKTFTLTVTDGDTANHVVIGEVWGDGGFGSASYKNSFIELYNPTDNNIDLSGDSIAYLASNNSTNTGTPGATQQTSLTGTIPAHGFYLVAGVSSNGGAAGVDLPAPDDNSTINWHFADGTLALIDTQDTFTMPTGDITGAAHVVDAIGYGVSTGFAPFAYEGAVTAFVTGTNIAAQRSPIGTDTNNNHADFTANPPYAINSNGDSQPALTLAGVNDQTALVNTPSTIATLQATGGVGAITYGISGQPAGIGVDASTGLISGTPTASGVYAVTATATDTLHAKATITFKITVGTFLVTNPGDQSLAVSSPADIQLVASPANTQGYGFAVKSGSTLPAGLSLDATTGEITGTPTAIQSATPVTITVTNKDDSTTIDVTFKITVTNSVMSIASIQGTAPRSTYAAATGTGAGQTVSTQGVVTAVWNKGYAGTGNTAALGAANSGLSGLVIQTPDAGVATSPASEAIFVFYAGTSFASKDANGAAIAVGDSVRVSGTVSEYKAASAVSNETATEITATVANTHKLGASLGSVTVQTALPATYADREAHEWEAYAPTDTVISDTYQFETDGELGVASGNKPLVQPTEICAADGTPASATCIQNAEQDIVNRGYFLGDGTNTFFTSASTHYNPSKSGNSAIPLPYMDATHSVRVGAHVTAATGEALILGFWPDLSSTSASRAGKWYLQPYRPVLGTPVSSTDQGTADLGANAVSFENTRASNATPDPANINHSGTSNIRVATFNVENFFTETGEAFAADNPAIGNSAAGTTSSTTKGCQYDYDRDANRTLTFQCVSPFGQATAWDPVSGAPTAYKAGLANAPRGAARQEDLDRQTAKIVTAINGLGGIDSNAVNHGSGADIVSLEEIENPNKLKQGITNSPLSPDLSNLKDQGQGTPIANRDAALKYLADKLNAAAGSDVWGYVKSPEEATDATSLVHMCSILRGDGVTPIDGNAAALANASCSYSSMEDVIRSAFIYKKATVVPVGPSDLDFPANPLSPDSPGNNAQPTYNGASPFDVAREPLAQYFKPVGHPNSDGFAVIVNHFKSKGGTSTSDDPNITITGDNKSDPLVGAYNQARIKQGQELVRFANQFAAQWHTDKVLILGDFNSYTEEDPIKAILDASQADPGNGGDPLDFSLLESSDANDITYNFTSDVNVGTDATGAVKVATPNTDAAAGTDQVGYGTVGSIDHEFMSAGFKSDFTGADVWEINANETDAYDYGRYNDNATNFYYGATQGNGIPSDVSYATDLADATPFRSSDHNPMVIGIDLPALDDANAATVTDVQIVGVNDFHGRLVADSSDGGAAALGGAVDELRDQYGADKTIFASGGDNVGASTFESFTAHDKPSLDALTAMGLDVSTVGNHEFDGQPSLGAGNVGWKDIVNRLMKPYDASTNPYGPAATAADPNGLPYLAANVTYSTDPDGAGPLQVGDPIAPPTKEISVTLNSGKTVKIGFVGTVTPDLTSLESPANLAGVHVDDEADTITAINQYADQLKSNGDKIVVLLTHEGAASTDCASMPISGSSFAQELNGINDNVDAVLSGHTHLEYSCSFAVPGWSGRQITARPVLQAGSYAVALDQLVYSFDPDGNPVDVTSNLVGVKGPVSTLLSAPDDPAVASIVSDAVAASATVGAQTLGKLGGPFDRARLSDGTENRGGESTLGNQIAEIQRWATSSDDPAGHVSSTNGSAQIAFMNPGGLRADLEGQNADGSGDLTYRTAANVQPFANELTNMSLTGAQLKHVLEEQWSRDNIDNAQANIPARPFLKLGVSAGFTYSYHEVPDPVHSGATLGVVDQMWLNGTPIDLTKHYSVTVNSFLASGGDNFWELANGAHQEDTEQTDLQAQVDYMKQYQSTPLPVDYSQHAVRVTFPANAPSTYSAGDPVTFSLSSLLMTGPHDIQDTSLTIKDGDTVLSSSIPVTASNSTQPYDDRGNASVTVTLPAGVAGDQVLTVYGNQTGTGTPEAYIKLPGVQFDSSVSADDQDATYGSAGSLTATVTAGVPVDGTVTFSEGDTTLGQADVGADGTATLALPVVTLAAGTHTITATYGGSTGLRGSTTTFTLTVGKAELVVTADDQSIAYGQALPVFTSSVSGLVGSDQLVTAPTCVSNATAASPVGLYTISCSGADAGANYTVAYVDAVLSIAQAHVVVTVTGTIIHGVGQLEYSASTPVSGLSVTGASCSTVSGGTAVDASLPVGSYPFDPASCSGGVLSNDNYVIDHYTGTLTVLAVGVTSTTLPDAPIGKAYVGTLTAAGGKTPYSWSLAGGSLPTGLTLYASGKITGTPTVAGTSTFTVKVTDSSSPKNTATHTVTLTVVPMAITTASLPDGLVQKVYSSQTLKATGGKGTLAWSIGSGSLPTGMKISPSGTISGTPTVTGTFSFTVKVADSSTPKNTATKTYTFVIAPMSITTTSLPAGKVKSYYSQAIKAVGGKTAYTWSISSGALPPGLRLAVGVGSIYGTPTTAGSYTFTIHVADKGTPTNTASQVLTIVINP
jgi:5'-nucleotidase